MNISTKKAVELEGEQDMRVLKEALTLYLAHQEKVIGPGLVGDEDMTPFQERESSARELLANIYELEYEANPLHYSDDYEPPDAGEITETVRGSSLYDDVLQFSHVSIQRRQLRTLERVTDDDALTVGAADRALARSHANRALGNEQTSDELMDDYRGMKAD